MSNQELEKYFQTVQHNTRRHFLKSCMSGLGAVALSGLTGCNFLGSGKADGSGAKSFQIDDPFAIKPSHFAPKAKRVIFLHMAGAPSQLELFDYKPLLKELHGQDCPPSLLEGKRFAFIKGVPKMMGPLYDFKQHGQSGAYVSDRLPHFSKVVDDVTFIKTMHTDQFNHAPAQLFLHTGSPLVGRPSAGAWVSYGLGSENKNLPGYMVLVSGGNNPSAGKQAWSSGFLPSVYQGVQCRSKGEPILYAANPKDVDETLRRTSIEAINEINSKTYDDFGDPETLTRISQYEMAFKMQTSVPDVMDISKETEETLNLYGAQPGEASFANNCLLARRLVEKGVRFVQLFDWGWDHHGSSEFEALNVGFKQKCNEIDQPIAALITDLKRRGLLEDTLVVWAGEFGRTPMQENRKGDSNPFAGRDHHPDAFTIWMAGAGVKPGITHGETDEIGYIGIKDRVHVHDFQATMLHLLGMNHEKLTYPFQGRDFRLTDVAGEVVNGILA